MDSTQIAERDGADLGEGTQTVLSYEEERGKPMPSFNHSFVQANLILELGKYRQYRICSELELEFDGKSYVPDLSLYPRAPVDLLSDVIRRTDAPPLVVEILSPTQGLQAVMDKMRAYLQHGVQSCWIVVPPTRNVTIFTAAGGEQNFHGGMATDPVLDVTADLDAVFS